MFGIWTFDGGSLEVVGRHFTGRAVAAALSAIAYLCAAPAFATASAQPSAPNDSALVNHVMDLLDRNYDHGMPLTKAHALGDQALPILAGVLRDDSSKRLWWKSVAAIGAIGDTSYFDTLHAFMWDRFRGPVDRPTYMALKVGPGALAIMGAQSQRITEYLIAGTDSCAWNSIPWTFDEVPKGSTGRSLAEASQIALAYVDNDRAAAYIEDLKIPESPLRRIEVEGLKRVSKRVRKDGTLKAWEELERTIH